MMMKILVVACFTLPSLSSAFTVTEGSARRNPFRVVNTLELRAIQQGGSISDVSRRDCLALAGISLVGLTSLRPLPAEAVGPIKVNLTPLSYDAKPCPPSKPIPGQMAMKGMRGLCVTVEAELDEQAPKPLEKVGVYGFVTDGETGDSVLANNPDLSTDSGQFAMIEAVSPKDKKIRFEFIAAVPQEKDLSKFDNGIGPLNFESIRIVSYPGGQQFGAISPCEMNEFSEECEVWEAENGPYQRGEFMMKGKMSKQ